MQPDIVALQRWLFVWLAVAKPADGAKKPNNIHFALAARSQTVSLLPAQERIPMKRRAFFRLLGGGVAAGWPLVALAQAERVRRIGVLMALEANDPEGQSEVRGLKQGLQDLGWVEGRNLQIEYSWPGGDPDRIHAAAKELAARQCDVIVARSTPVVAALLKETRTIPIVFGWVVDPVGSGFVQSFPHPGGNVTGFQNLEFSMVGKWIELLTKIAPSVQRVVYIYNLMTVPTGFLRALAQLGPSIPVKLVAAPVHNSAEIDVVIAEFAREPGGGLMMMPDTFNEANYAQIIALAEKHGLPAVYPHRFRDGLISYGPDLPNLFKRAASYVDRILRGEKPAELPVQAPTKYELVINLKTAETLGLAVPQSLIVAADEVID
jgi:putative ABC transport system substrate-binding protein